ncbi:hypothetical protein NMY22_g213 [Coprinellus aureogranulatus]|nr:hypothetical protein NMY22_g213 [Coprinellus aureogranulatus]
MSYTLPLELILLIVSTLDGDMDKESLKSFALASSTFRIPCQRILFFHIRITYSASMPGRRKTLGERLFDLLSVSHPISTYVKQVTISDCWDGPGNINTWLEVDEKLGEALGMIDPLQVQALTLRRPGLQVPNQCWQNLPDLTRKAIIEICQSPVLRELCLQAVPFDLVNHCGPSLKRSRAQRSSNLTLEYLMVYDKLHLEMMVASILNPSSRIRVDCLRTLHVKISKATDHAEVPLLLESCHSSLETLVLEPGISVEIRNPADLFTIGFCPNLTTLRLKVNANQSNRGRQFQCFSWAAIFVACIPSVNVLQDIYLDLNFYPRGEVPGSWTTETESTLSSTLRSFGNNVAHEPYFSRLNALKVRICIPDPTEAAIQTVRAWATRELSAPHERKLLHLSVSPVVDDGV